MTSSSTRTRAPRAAAVDAICAAAVDAARAAVEQDADVAHVGAHLGVRAEGDRAVTHLFACTSPGYLGWQWAVTVVRAPRAKVVTIAEVVLVPGEGAILAPVWVPWSERLRPGDLGVGDLLPAAPDDLRLVPSHAAAFDDEIDVALHWELGLGRPRVLSPIGRDDASDRWYDGDRGPLAEIAVAAPAPCTTCGFLLPLAGSMRGLFGVCANEFAPDDGRVVSYDHGCGAHSESAAAPLLGMSQPPHVDEVGYYELEVTPAGHSPGSVEDAAPAEDLGHS